jgi:hypothetical protein
VTPSLGMNRNDGHDLRENKRHEYQGFEQSRLGRLINRGSYCDRMIFIFSKSKVIAYGLKKSCPTMPAK